MEQKLPHIKHLYLDDSPGKGKGVFAGKSFSCGEQVELCHIIPVTGRELSYLNSTFLENYLVRWTDEADAFCLGYGFMYNHSDNPNTYREWNFVDNTISFRTLIEVPEGTELTIKYVCDLWWEKPLNGPRPSSPGYYK